jgi:hypothetical protein
MNELDDRSDSTVLLSEGSAPRRRGRLHVFLAAAAVGGLVDRLTRQGVQTARAKAEAEDLARLAADSVVSVGKTAETVSSIRAIFDLDAVALLRRQGAAWRVEASAGKARPQRPDQTSYSVELPDGRVLVLDGNRLSSDDAVLLRAFPAQLRTRRERALLDGLETTTRLAPPPGG